MKLEDLKMTMELALAKARATLEYNWDHPGEERGLVQIGLGFEDKPVEWIEMPVCIDLTMNHARAKTMLFDGVNQLAQMRGASAVFTVTDAFIGMPTEKNKALSDEEAARIMVHSGKTLNDLVREGWVYRREAIVVMAQTPERVYSIRQFYDRAANQILWDTRKDSDTDPSNFQGRQKLFRGARHA